MSAAAEPNAVGPLPYGPLMSRLLRPLPRGFLVLNGGFMAPLIRSGFGWVVGSPLGGWFMLLRTCGRKSGRIREAPLGYVIRDGAVYCVAGYGASTPWYLNLVAEPSVEVILPARRFRGRAEPVTEPTEWLGAYRALIASFGLIGRAVVGETRDLDDAALLARHGVLPVTRITPITGERPLAAGVFDPGGHGWLVPYGAQLVVGVLALRWLAHRGHKTRPR
jgi:deazaflavin-dependent oxidoreductase (nitroreductase family)